MSTFDKLLKLFLKPTVAASYLSMVVLSFFYFDKPIALYFHSFHLKETVPILYWITQLGTGGIYVVGLLALALLFRYIYRRKQWEMRCWFLWLCVLIPYLLCGLFKMVLGRARPELLFSSDLFGFFGWKNSHAFWSMPSGHTTAVMGLFFGLTILFPRYVYWFFTASVIVISTRVLLTNHYLSDVLASSYLVLLEIGLLMLCIRRYCHHSFEKVIT